MGSPFCDLGVCHLFPGIAWCCCSQLNAGVILEFTRSVDARCLLANPLKGSQDLPRMRKGHKSTGP